MTAADVLAWDRDRGQPPLGRGWSPEEEAKVLAAADGQPAVGRAVRRG